MFTREKFPRKKDTHEKFEHLTKQFGQNSVLLLDISNIIKEKN